MIEQMHSTDSTDEKIPFTPGGVTEGKFSWEPEHEQETSFKGQPDSKNHML